VAVIVPAQLSVELGAVTGVTQSTVAAGNELIFGAGAVMSSKIIFWLAVTMFPLPSLNVHVTTVVPCVVIGKVVVVVPVSVPAQLSVVVGAVGVIEHCPVTFDNVGVLGFVTSSRITF